MYAIVKTGGKQYKVAPGDKINIEKLDVEVGETVELPVICVVDGEKVEADPAKAGATKVTATVLEQFKDQKQIFFKFKRRKNYRRLRGHRQQLTRIEIESVGTERAAQKPDDKAATSAETEENVEDKGAAAKEATSKEASSKDGGKKADKKTDAADKAKKAAAEEDKADEKQAEAEAVVQDDVADAAGEEKQDEAEAVVQDSEADAADEASEDESAE